jgi:integrase
MEDDQKPRSRGKTRTLHSGRTVTIHRNDGLRKRCDCPRRSWATCSHAWHFAFKWQDEHYRFPLGRPFTRDGKTYRFPAEGDCSKRQEAKTEADKLRAAIRERGCLPTPVTSAPAAAADLTFEAFATKWRENARAHDLSVGESQRLNDRAVCTRLGDLLVDGERLAVRPIGRITEDDLEALFRQLAHLAASTWNKYRDVIRMLQAWGVDKGYLMRPWMRENGIIAHRSEKGDKRNRRLVAYVVDDKGKLTTVGEERRLLDAADPWLRNLIIAALESGMRRGELLALQWRDVDRSRGLLTVRAENAKSGVSRAVPISPRLRGVLAMIDSDPAGNTHKPTAFVFGNAIGEQVKDPKKAWATCVLKAHDRTPEWTKRGLSKASQAALKAIDLRFHDLRHEAGSRMLEAGWPLQHVQAVLGHTDASTTSRYLNATTEHLIDSMKRFGVQPLHPLAQSTAEEPPLSVQPDSPEAPKVLVN